MAAHYRYEDLRNIYTGQTMTTDPGPIEKKCNEWDRADRAVVVIIASIFGLAVGFAIGGCMMKSQMVAKLKADLYTALAPYCETNNVTSSPSTNITDLTLYVLAKRVTDLENRVNAAYPATRTNQMQLEK